MRRSHWVVLGLYEFDDIQYVAGVFNTRDEAHDFMESRGFRTDELEQWRGSEEIYPMDDHEEEQCDCPY